MKKLTLALALLTTIAGGSIAQAADYGGGPITLARGQADESLTARRGHGWGRGGRDFRRGPGYGYHRRPRWDRRHYPGYYCPLPQRILGLCW